jgi:hypothetical protein
LDVPDCGKTLALLIEACATERQPVTEVGDSIRVAAVLDPAGDIIRIIENPHFGPAEVDSSAGPLHVSTSSRPRPESLSDSPTRLVGLRMTAIGRAPESELAAWRGMLRVTRL